MNCNQYNQQHYTLYPTNAYNSNIYCTFNGFVLTDINKQQTIMSYSNRSSMKMSISFRQNRKKHYKMMLNILEYYSTDLI
jgi:hypothetical protein